MVTQIDSNENQVCKAEECWIRLQKADGITMMVRSKDDAFVMPENIVGKRVLVEGNATVKETSEHYVEDAGNQKKKLIKLKV